MTGHRGDHIKARALLLCPPCPAMPRRAPTLALVRGVPDSFPRCLRTGADAPDLARAREQHAAYVAALESCGVATQRLPADEAFPDCCFIEDTAVVQGGRAFVTRPGAPSRRGECDAVAAALAGRLEVTRMAGPGLLDGGDVLRVGPWLFVGLSGRTDLAGAEELAAWAGLELRTIPVERGLHLKSAVTVVDDQTIVLDVAALDPGHFAGLEVIAAGEPPGGNVLALGERLLVSAAAPRTIAALRGRAPLTTLELSEIHRADGALTCLSLRVPPPGCWCA